MQFFYENQNSNSFLVYRLEDTDKLDSFNYGMLANNKINNIIPANLTQVNTDKYLKYNVSSMVTLKQYFEGVVNKKRIVNVFLSICNALIDANEYMIDSSMIILDSEYIFVDVSTAKASLICFPIVGYSCEVKAIDFFKNIIFTTQYDRTENSDYVAEIITFLNSGDNFSIDKFKSMMLRLSGSAPTSPTPAVQPIQKPVQQKVEAVQQEPSKPPVVESVKPVQQKVEATPSPQTQPPVKDTPSNVGFAIPGGGSQVVDDKKNGKAKKEKKSKDSTKEDKMSFMHLLSNFSKENLEIYKAQKEQGGAADGEVALAEKPEKKPKKKDKKPVGNPVAGFAIPGQSAAVQTPTPVQHNEPQVNQPVQQAVNQPVVNNGVVNNSNPNRPVVQEVNGNFGQTVNLSAMAGGTTVLGADPSASATSAPTQNPRLIRSKNNETVKINKPVFRIGKENSYVDYFIADNSAISRSHANVVCKEEGYFVVDTNSTNHTYVNGVMVQPNVEMQINDKDIIRLADEDFEFRIF